MFGLTVAQSLGACVILGLMNFAMVAYVLWRVAQIRVDDSPAYAAMPPQYYAPGPYSTREMLAAPPGVRPMMAPGYGPSSRSMARPAPPGYASPASMRRPTMPPAPPDVAMDGSVPGGPVEWYR